MTFPWCVENYAPASTSIGVKFLVNIVQHAIYIVVENKNRIPCGHYSISRERGNDLEGGLHQDTSSFPKLFTINQWSMIPPPTGTFVMWNFCLQHPTPANSMAGAPWFSASTGYQRKYTLHPKLHVQSKWHYKDSTHFFHGMFTLLQSGKRYRSIRSRTSRLLNQLFSYSLSDCLTQECELHLKDCTF